MFFKKLAVGAAVAALPLSLAALPAQAAVDLGDCGNDVKWAIVNPARYINTGDHEAVVGLSDAKRTVQISVPAGCNVEVGDKWRVYNGYFSAEGTFSAGDLDTDTDGAGSDTADGSAKDSDVVYVEKPSSNSVAGDDINVKLKINDADANQTGWEIDEGTAGDLNILRRTEFKYKSTANRLNFSPEPYVDTVNVRGNLIRANWSAGRYDGYEGRNVHIQTRTDVTDSDYGDVGGGETTTGTGGVVSFTFKVSDVGGPAVGDPFIGRGLYNGNGTSSGTVSIGDRVLSAS